MGQAWRSFAHLRQACVHLACQRDQLVVSGLCANLIRRQRAAPGSQPDLLAICHSSYKAVSATAQQFIAGYKPS